MTLITTKKTVNKSKQFYINLIWREYSEIFQSACLSNIEHTLINHFLKDKNSIWNKRIESHLLVISLL